MNKKIIIIGGIIGIVFIGVIMFLVTRGNSSSVVGKWVIDSYNTANGNVKQGNIGEYYGENYQNANAGFSAVFDDNGTVILNMPFYEGMEPVRKEVSCEIYLSAEGKNVKGFDIKVIH